MDAVRLVGSGERDISQVALDLGVRPDMSRKWVVGFAEDKEESFPGSGRLKPADEELRKARSELRRVPENPQRRKRGEAGERGKVEIRFVPHQGLRTC